MSDWTSLQRAANEEANRLRERLAELEKGSSTVETLVQQKGEDAGTWEGYRLSNTIRKTEQDIRISDTARNEIKRQTEEYIIASAYGRNIDGINAWDVEKGIRTVAERTADEVLSLQETKIDRMRSEVIVAYDFLGILGDYSSSIASAESKKKTFEFLKLDTLLFDVSIDISLENMNDIERLLLANPMVQRREGVYNALLEIATGGGRTDSSKVDDLIRLMSNDPAFKRIWREEKLSRVAEIAKEGGSLILSLLNRVGDIKDIGEAIYGKDVITDKKLSGWGRVLNAIPIIGEFKALLALGVVVDISKITDLKVLGKLDDVNDAIKLKRAGASILDLNKLDNIGGLTDDVVDVLNKGMFNSTENLTSLYRAVGPDEFYDIMKTGEFSVIPNGLQAKQFGLSFEETLKFADKYSDIGAIIEVKVPSDILSKIGDFTQIDKFIFKSGTVTIHADELGEFNKLINEIIHKY